MDDRGSSSTLGELTRMAGGSSWVHANFLESLGVVADKDAECSLRIN